MFALQEMLQEAIERKASDIHLSSSKPPILRIDGDLEFQPLPPLVPEDVLKALEGISSHEQQADFEKKGDADFSFDFGGKMRFRVNAFQTVDGPAMVMRLIPANPPNLQQIGAPPVMKQMARLKKGLVLVTGPTGSGKSTTLAALIDYINDISHSHVLTIEDPIEYIHKSRKALINQREVGRHSGSFHSALRGALREDPNVILVGEMRDLETISLALTAAETGHLVLATLHTSSAAKAVDRIIDVFSANEKALVRTMVAGSLQAVVAQTLLRKIGGGRVAAFEVLVANQAVRNLIRENKIFQMESMIQLGAKHGMQSMKESVQELVVAGKVSVEEADDLLHEIEAEKNATDEGGGVGGSRAAALHGHHPASGIPQHHQ